MHGGDPVEIQQQLAMGYWIVIQYVMQICVIGKIWISEIIAAHPISYS